MRLITTTALALLGASLVVATPASAQITWSWSFGAEAGQFLTNGIAPGGVAAPGTYSFVDFIVTASGEGAPLGSVSGGDYLASGLGSVLPYDFDWDGSSVTRWNSGGVNSFDWWVFDQVSDSEWSYLFGWKQNNVNDATQADYYSVRKGFTQPSAFVTVTPGATTTVPEPSSVILVAAGIIAIGVHRRRNGSATALVAYPPQRRRPSSPTPRG